ncbi:MAG: hypothetical protein RLZZ142_1047 [Verrucomicrobiota bacterium]
MRSDEAFSVPPQLANASVRVCELPLSSVWLMDNQRFPWLLLIPRVAGVSELIDLSEADQSALWREIADASRALRELFTPDKLNVAMIGNLVPQLHVHVIARFRADDAWPKPVFGFAPPIAYAEERRAALVRELQGRLLGEAAGVE